LRGLFGVDGILGDGSFWPVEINPRYTASIEVLEYATNVQALAWQRMAFQPGERAPALPSGPQQFIGKAILFAPQDLIFPREGPWLSTLDRLASPDEMPAFADIPVGGEPIARGRPILTFFVKERKLALVEEALRAVADELFRCLFYPAGGS
jgi:predicted ATP-grasp superfamily ATP-dependent carboligase